MPDKINLPKNTHRTVLIGRTGTGKTVGGLWHLSNYDLQKPWVVFNFKDDEHIESIENTQPIDYSYVPDAKAKGLYIINVHPSDARGSALKTSPLSAYFEKLWARQNVGIFVDEAFMVGNDDNFNLCLTQGRSRHIPMIVCTQRPCWISRYCWSEATFIQVFDLTNDDDINTVEGFIPLDWDEEKPLGDHQSWYYEVSKKKLYRFNPVPDMNEIRKRLASKLHRKRVFL